MDSVSITRLKASVFASVLAFYNALQAKQVKGPVFTHSIIEAIVSECHIIMSSFGRIDSIIIRNKETLASTLDPNTSHLGAISELALSGLSITLLLLREEVQQVTGEKVKFWKKVDYLWNEVTLNGLLANLHEQQIVWSLLVNSMQSASIIIVRQILQDNNAIFQTMVQKSQTTRESIINRWNTTLVVDDLSLSSDAYRRAYQTFANAFKALDPEAISVDGMATSKPDPSISVSDNTGQADPLKIGSAETTSAKISEGSSQGKTQLLDQSTSTSSSSHTQLIASTSSELLSECIGTNQSEITKADKLEPTDSIQAASQGSDEQIDTEPLPKEMRTYQTPTTSVNMPESTASRHISSHSTSEKTNIALRTAAEYGHTAMIKMLLNKGVDITATDPKLGDTALFIAAKNGKLEALEVICDAILMKDPVGLFALNEKGDTVLHAACANFTSIAVIDHLIAHRAFDVEQAGHNGWRPVHHAAAKNNMPLLEHLFLKYKADLNAGDINGSSPLHLAARNGHIQAMTMLLDHHADISAWNVHKRQAIHSAALEDQKEAVKILLDRGAGIESTQDSVKPMTPIYCAIESKKLETLIFLLEHGADPTANTENDQPIHFAAEFGTEAQILALLAYPAVSLEKASNDAGLGLLPIHEAAWAANMSTMRCLIGLGVEIESRGAEGRTPLHMAASRGKLAAVEYLLEAGADVNSKRTNGSTPLHEAAHKGHLTSVKSLLKAGADPALFTTNNLIYLPIHRAAEGGDISTILLLLDAYPAGLEAIAKNGKHQLTTLGIAAMAGHLHVIDTLVEHGADINSLEGGVIPPIHVAARTGQPQLVLYLKKAGVDMNMIDTAGWTPLMTAVEFSKVDVMKALLDSGADIERVETGANQGRAIHYAAATKTTAQLECLIERGADIEATMNSDMRPLFLAAKYGHLPCIKALLEAGAKPDAVDAKGRTALDIAVIQGHIGAVELLL